MKVQYIMQSPNVRNSWLWMGVPVKTVVHQWKSSKVKKGNEFSTLVGDFFFSLGVYCTEGSEIPHSDAPIESLFALIYFLIAWIKHTPDVLLCMLRSNR